MWCGTALLAETTFNSLLDTTPPPRLRKMDPFPHSHSETLAISKKKMRSRLWCAVHSIFLNFLPSFVPPFKTDATCSVQKSERRRKIWPHDALFTSRKEVLGKLRFLSDFHLISAPFYRSLFSLSDTEEDASRRGGIIHFPSSSSPTIVAS